MAMLFGIYSALYNTFKSNENTLYKNIYTFTTFLDKWKLFYLYGNIHILYFFENYLKILKDNLFENHKGEDRAGQTKEYKVKQLSSVNTFGDMMVNMPKKLWF